MYNNKLILTAGMIACFVAIAPLMTACTSTTKTESTGQYVDSSAITLKVKSRLAADKYVKSLPITVKTYKNIVQLSGFVDDMYQEQRAVNIAQSVPGVVEVQNSLIVKKRPK